MFVRTLIVAGALMALSGPVLAQTASGMTLQQFQAENGDKWFARLDTNKDGKISPEEFEAFRDKHKAEAEASDTASGKTAKAGKDAKRSARMFAHFDTDHDGFISRTEANAVLAMRFKRMDTNNDGVLTLEELQAKGGKSKVGI